jgi:hypothetical protein
MFVMRRQLCAESVCESNADLVSNDEPEGNSFHILLPSHFIGLD